MMVKENLKVIVLSHLKSKKITSSELAQKCNINQSTASRILNGKQDFSLDYALMIAEKIGLNVNLIVSEKNEI